MAFQSSSTLVQWTLLFIFFATTTKASLSSATTSMVKAIRVYHLATLRFLFLFHSLTHSHSPLLFEHWIVELMSDRFWSGRMWKSESRVRNKAVGVNFIDVYFRKGVYKAPSFPFTPGSPLTFLTLTVTKFMLYYWLDDPCHCTMPIPTHSVYPFAFKPFIMSLYGCKVMFFCNWDGLIFAIVRVYRCCSFWTD